MAMKDTQLRVIDDVTYRLMEERDVTGMLTLLKESRPGIMGMSTDDAYSALCRAGLHDPSLTIAVAECEGEIAAIFLVVTEWKQFWPRFLTRNFLTGARVVSSIVRRRIRNRLRKGAPDAPRQEAGVEQWVAPTPSGRDWSDNGPEIAKGIFLGTNSKFRGRRIAQKIYAYLLDALRDNGYKRYDACVDFRNVPSLRLTSNAGLRMEVSGNRYFGTMDL